jgi:hypothetical protein
MRRVSPGNWWPMYQTLAWPNMAKDYRRWGLVLEHRGSHQWRTVDLDPKWKSYPSSRSVVLFDINSLDCRCFSFCASFSRQSRFSSFSQALVCEGMWCFEYSSYHWQWQSWGLPSKFGTHLKLISSTMGSSNLSLPALDVLQKFANSCVENDNWERYHERRLGWAAIIWRERRVAEISRPCQSMRDSERNSRLCGTFHEWNQLSTALVRWPLSLGASPVTSLRSYGPKSVILAIFSGIAKLKSPQSLHNFLTAIDWNFA